MVRTARQTVGLTTNTIRTTGNIEPKITKRITRLHVITKCHGSNRENRLQPILDYG